MRGAKTKAGFLVGLVVATRIVACSPKSGDDGIGGRATGTGAFGNLAGGTDPNGGGGEGGGCPEITQKPEEIITYRDATVTDTIITYSPIALYIMLDRSGSMITGFPEGSAQSWANSTSAITGFMGDPAS